MSVASSNLTTSCRRGASTQSFGFNTRTATNSKRRSTFRRSLSRPVKTSSSHPGSLPKGRAMLLQEQASDSFDVLLPSKQRPCHRPLKFRVFMPRLESRDSTVKSRDRDVTIRASLRMIQSSFYSRYQESSRHRASRMKDRHRRLPSAHTCVFRDYALMETQKTYVGSSHASTVSKPAKSRDYVIKAHVTFHPTARD